MSIVKLTYLACVLLSLAACGAPYDAALYTKITNAANSIEPSVCAKAPADVLKATDSFNTQWDWISLYAKNKPGEQLTARMLDDVTYETAGLNAVIHTGATWSPGYCVAKLTGMRHTIEQILRTESRKAAPTTSSTSTTTLKAVL